MASHAQCLVPLAAASSKVVEHVRDGGGLAYSEFDDLDWGVEVGDTAYWDEVFLDTLRSFAPEVAERLEVGASVADIACGDGHKGNVMARAYPQSVFVGYDFLADTIATARKEAGTFGLSNSTFKEQNVADLDLVAAFDVITVFDAIHDQRAPRDVLAVIHRALKPDGIFLMADIQASSRPEQNIHHPLGSYFYLWSICHCMTVSLQ